MDGDGQLIVACGSALVIFALDVLGPDWIIITADSEERDITFIQNID